MAEYDLAFAAKLAEVADQVEEKAPNAYDARRVVVYMSRLSLEITLKAVLERAGKPVSEIRARSHNLRQLLADLGNCEVEIEIAPGTRSWVPASRLMSVSINLGMGVVPIGEIIEAEDQGASQYPNQIRYGSTVIDVDPYLLAQTAVLAAAWARDHWNVLRLK